MNSSRRNKLIEIHKSITKSVSEIRRSLSELQAVIDEEADAFDGIPENLQGSSRAMEMEDNIDVLCESLETIDGALDDISDAI